MTKCPKVQWNKSYLLMHKSHVIHQRVRNNRNMYRLLSNEVPLSINFITADFMEINTKIGLSSTPTFEKKFAHRTPFEEHHSVLFTHCPACPYNASFYMINDGYTQRSSIGGPRPLGGPQRYCRGGRESFGWFDIIFIFPPCKFFHKSKCL